MYVTSITDRLRGDNPIHESYNYVMFLGAGFVWYLALYIVLYGKAPVLKGLLLRLLC
jgi:hypothetical protein